MSTESVYKASSLSRSLLGRGALRRDVEAGNTGNWSSTLIPCCCLWLLKHVNVKKCVIAIILLSFLLMIVYINLVPSSTFASFMPRDTRPMPMVHCRLGESSGGASPPDVPAPDHRSEARLRIDPKVLVFVESAYTKLCRDIAELLVHNRIKYKVEVSGKSLPVLTNLDKGRYGVIVFENLSKYLTMDKWNRELLDKYCREYSVGIVGFVSPTEDTLVGAQLKGFPLFIHTNLRLKDATLNPASPVLRLTRPGETAWGSLPGDDWTIFQANSSTYEPVEWASRYIPDYPEGNRNKTLLATVIQDHGRLDSIQRVIFGSGLRFWLHRLLFLDALSYLSHGQLSLSLDRMILVDIDDIFVGERGTRLRTDDVQALLSTQSRIRHYVPGFKFNLGFSGKYFHHGIDEENKGDDMILENVDKFMWFSHMWNHQQPHLYDNLTQLELDMNLNREFAMVLPRQTCGLFTHTMLIDRYPGGRDKLDESIQGGELFQTIVYNSINIFMTHMSNYGNDRLALYTFESVLKFLRCWTNIRLSSSPPVQLAEKYFKLHPEEMDPVWGNPCDDVRHQRIWSRNKSCSALPHFLVIGPQKTGTTALYSFLSLHPALASNIPSPTTFEEIQFFNANNYYKGLDWYMNFFPPIQGNTSRYTFEKSATYFDGELVPKRAHALLPNAKLVTILISPAKRAYSWYQHIKYHGDIVANNYSFHEVITANDTAPKPLRDLRNRCLNPGKYSHHLDRWLMEFAPNQLHIIDGSALRSDPAEVMNALQRFLKITPCIDYSKMLKYDPKKGFFCQLVNGDHTKCLGKSKGRNYPAMEEKSSKFLQRYYMSHNTALVKLLKKFGNRTIPHWLKDDLSTPS
ncbi:N-deacetylase and N-sulfotransferase sfl isoform X2 [Arctopsyche grandis]|uniref:N-deacetylase and N-sulfotransferase sfl isoform X2 n=1 Tax=Arctopsyche grandis TaxID=121162 RepID=UPI00406D96A7